MTGRTSQAATMVEKKAAPAPTIAAATSHKSSESTRANRARTRAVRGPRYPYRVPGPLPLICTRDRSSPLSPVFDDVRSGIRRVSGVGTIARLIPQVVPGIQPLTASPVPKLVPEIQLPLHLPASTLFVFLYFISRHYGIPMFLGRQALGLHLAPDRMQETWSSQVPSTVDPLRVSCILYHRNRQ